MSTLDRLRRQLQELNNPRTLHDLYNLAGNDVYALIQQGFALEQDPDGVPWIPSRAAQRQGRRTLRDTGRLQDGISWKADSRGLVVSTGRASNSYAAYVQRGTRATPARRFMPDVALPRAYQQQLQQTFTAYFQSWFG